jgi:hypothetical protein
MQTAINNACQDSDRDFFHEALYRHRNIGNHSHNMTTSIRFLVCLAFVFINVSAFAKARPNSSTPIALSLVPPVQFPPSSFIVKGIRLGVISSNRDVNGIDIGLIGTSTSQEFAGLQIAGLYNYNGGEATIVGAQIALGANINKGTADVYGLQLALANVAKYTNVNGAQIGLYNRANIVRGIQIGLVNHCSNLYGLQIGLANLNDNGPFVVSPIINFGW